MVGEHIDRTEPHVGQRTQGQRNPVPYQPGDQLRRLHAPQSMVYPLHPEHVQRLDDVLRRPLLPGVRHPPQPQRRRGLVHLAELHRRMSHLGGVEPHTDDPVEIRLGGLEGLESGLRGLVPQEAHDQLRGDAVRVLAAGQRPPQPLDDRPHLHAPRDVRLRVEEDLRVPHPLRGGPGEIGVRQVLEVPLGAQDGHELVVQVQKGLEVLEPVRLAERVRVGVRQRDAVARGQLESQLRLQSAFDVQVQFSFGEGHQSIVRLLYRRFGTGTRRRSWATVSSPS